MILLHKAVTASRPHMIDGSIADYCSAAASTVSPGVMVKNFLALLLIIGLLDRPGFDVLVDKYEVGVQMNIHGISSD